jgi:ABC-type Mn2+/Zn2+ transport system permease subunit
VLFSASFALGIVLLNFADTGVRDLSTLLLGNVLGISTLDLIVTAGVVVVVLTVIAVFFKELVLVSFDPALAQAHGRSIAVWDGLLFVLLAVALTAAFQTVGNLLVLALLLAPAATARLLTRQLVPMIGVAIGLAIFAGVVGLYVSYWRNVPSGPAIVLLSGLMFGLALLFGPQHGAVWNMVRRHQLQRATRTKP